MTVYEYVGIAAQVLVQCYIAGIKEGHKPGPY